MSATAPPRARSRARRRVRVRVSGTVQGVGFRPFVYRLAREHGLAGFVFNDGRGVVAEAEGAAASVAAALAQLECAPPPLAVIEAIRVEELPTRGGSGFAIRESPRRQSPDTPVAADSTTCASCLRELHDPADRRYRYPFINCTDCGPRFTIVRGIPYDRPYTTMAGFRMCPRCQSEYEDPGDRRFHAQPNACPACGPQARLLDAGGTALGGAGADALSLAAGVVAGGLILAVKGLGGYHLACLAADEDAVARLRARKHREQKPFALMVDSSGTAAELGEVGEEERLALESPARPIVLLARRAEAPVASGVAPHSGELGVMLAYTPLHHLLLGDLRASGIRRPVLVMTSGNRSDEPIAFRDADARERLDGIAEAFLVHDRPIETRTDDSVVRVVAAAGARRVMPLRRSRGYVPAPLTLPRGLDCPPLLACGAELKHTLCVARGRRAWVSHHIGDLENAETYGSFVEAVDHLGRLFGVAPQLVAHDLHPEYLSTKYAMELDGVELVGVAHHHAHLAACLAEHGEQGPAVAAVFDGAGLGSDGTIWGGEILYGGLETFTRCAHLLALRLPGGEQAVRQPWRMACAWLCAAMGDGASGYAPPRPPQLAHIEAARWRAVAHLATAPAMPLTSSAGRLFDAVAALCGIRDQISYEGQAAIELEAACDPHERGRLPFTLHDDGERLVIDPRPAVSALVSELAAGTSPRRLATRFHRGLAETTAEACLRVAAARGTELAVLTGGVFANRRLLESVAARLHGAGLRVLWAQRLPPGDGAISYGQAAVAAARSRT